MEELVVEKLVREELKIVAMMAEDDAVGQEVMLPIVVAEVDILCVETIACHVEGS